MPHDTRILSTHLDITAPTVLQARISNDNKVLP
jgi:hypothetical protein